MEPRQGLRAIALGNLAGAVCCAVAGGVFVVSRNPEFALAQAGMPMVFMSVLMPLMLVPSHALAGAAFIAVAGALLASAVGIWRGDRSARRLECVLAWAAIVIFCGSGAM